MHKRSNHSIHHPISYLLTPLLLAAMLVGCAAPANYDASIVAPTSDASSSDLPVATEPSKLDPEKYAAANYISQLIPVDNTMADQVSDGPNCLVTGEGTGFSSRGGGDDMPPDLVHGQFVWETLQKYLGQQVNGKMAPDLPDIENGVQAQVALTTTVITTDNLPVVIFVIDEFHNPELGIGYDAPSQLYVVPGAGRDHYILLQAVDIEQFNLIEVTNDLKSAIASRKIDSWVSTQQPIALPPLQEFVFNMSWIVVPCNTMPEDADLTDYFDAICLTTSEQEAHDLSKLSGVVSAVNRAATGREAANAAEAVTLVELCQQLTGEASFRTGLDLFGKDNQGDKTDIVSNFALRGLWLRGIYEELAAEGLTTSLTEPIDNDGFQALNCFTNDAAIDAAISDTIGAAIDATIAITSVIASEIMTDTTADMTTAITPVVALGESFDESAALIDDCLETRSNLDLADSDQVIPVAAAGNDKRPFPYLPAAWDSVLSVGANNYESNAAEIWMNGESSMRDPIDLWKGGSSFAAPRVSVWAALYLSATRSARCLSTPAVKPVLGIKSDWSQLVNEQVNLPLNVAAAECPEFKALVDALAP